MLKLKIKDIVDLRILLSAGRLCASYISLRSNENNFTRAREREAEREGDGT